MELGGSGSESADDLGEANRQLEQLRQQRGLGSEQHGFVARNLESALDILASQLNSKTTHFILELIQNADDNAYPSGVQPTFSLVLDKNGSNFTLRTDCNETGFSLKNIDAICSIGKSTKTGIINGQKGFIGEKGIGFKSVFKVAHQVDILSNFYEFRIDRTAHLGMLDPKPHRFPDTQRRLQQIKPELLLFLRQLSVLDIKVEDGHCVYRSIRQNRDPRYDGETVSLNEDRTGSPFDEPVKTTKLYLIVRYEVQDMPVDARRNSVSSTEITLALPVGSELETCDAFAFLPIDQSGFNFIVQADFLLVANRQALQHALPWNQRILEAIPDAFVQAVRHFNHADATHGYSLKYKWPLFLEYNGPKSSTWTEVHQGIKRRLCDEDVLEARDGSFRAVRPIPCPAGTQQTAAHKPLIIIPTEYRFDNGFLIDATINHGHHLAFEYDPVLEELKALDVKEMTGAGLRNEFSDWLERAGHAGLAAKSDKWHAALAAAFMWKGRSKQKDKLQELPLVHLADGSWAACAGGDIFFPSTGAVLNVPSDLGIRVVHSNAAKDPHRREFYTYLGVKKLDAETICSLILEKHAMIPRPTRKPLNWVLDILFLFRQKKLLATMDKKPRWFLVAGNRSIAEHVSEIQTPSSDLMDEFTGNTKYEFINRPELEKMFIGKVELLDVEASLRRSLVGAFGLHLRQLSKAVTEEVTWNNRGQTIDRNMTTSFRSRAAQFCRLSSNPTAEMLDRLKKTEVKTVSCINITRKLDGCAPIRDASRRHHVQELDDRIVIYHTTLTETDVMHLEDDFSGIVVRTCGIDDARWSRLVPFIMRVDPDQIMDFLDKHDVRDNNGPAFDMVDEWEQTKSENGQSEKEQGDQVIESGPAENAMDVGDGPDDLDLGGISFEDNDAGLYDDGDSEGVAPAKPDVLKKATEAAEIKLEETARHCPGTGPSSSPPTSNPTPLKNVRRRSRVEESSHTRKRQRVEKMTTPPSVDKISDDADGHDDMAIDDADKLLSEPTIAADVPPIPHEPNYPEVRKNVEALLSELLPGWQPYGDEMPDCYRYVDDGDETMLKFAKRFHLRADSFKHIAPQMKAGTTYCLDVKMTAGEVSTPFGLNKTQNHFALQHHKRDNTTNIVYLVLRVSHALHDIQGLLVILNPWTRRVDENDRTELQCSEWTVFNFE
ncbi:hypothetical protein VDGE_01904 [Verticillium dahliae]|uniref:Protein NO VEIN C-terminal domain-containing protein n=1 Tax=Verticillium dahliae TaxID=27337 RepID=A0A444SA79_VERDA|nr:hypothetical protein VDGE_01904 [Verticillium dahliae]